MIFQGDVWTTKGAVNTIPPLSGCSCWRRTATSWTGEDGSASGSARSCDGYMLVCREIAVSGCGNRKRILHV